MPDSTPARRIAIVAHYELSATYSKTTDPFLAAIMLKLYYNPLRHKLDNTIVYFTPQLLTFFFENLDTDATATLVCNSLATTGCASIWTLNNLNSIQECVSRLKAIPDLLVGEQNHFDGYSRGCRILHGVFAGKNPSHCPHISFLPQQDSHGKSKCQGSGANLQPSDFFTTDDFEFFSTYVSSKGVNPVLGYTLLPVAPRLPLRRYILQHQGGSKEEEPVCNDGTTAQYYLRSAPSGPSACWVIYVKGAIGLRLRSGLRS